MHIWYSLVQLDADYTCVVQCSNKTSDSLALSNGQIIAHIEFMSPATNNQIDAGNQPEFAYLRRILYPDPGQNCPSEPGTQVEKLDLDNLPNDDHDFGQPHVQNAHYSQHKAKCHMVITAITNESFWLTFLQTFIFSVAHSLTYLVRFVPHSEILWNWSRLICSYQITVTHLPATSDIIGGFCDLFTRDPKSL